MCRWCEKLANDLGVAPREEIANNRELVFEALRLELIAHHKVDATSEPPSRELSELAN
jgi:hypothetical protein